MNNAGNLLFFISGVPAPQPRPRLGRGRVFNPPSANTWRAAVALAAIQTGREFTGWVSVSIVFRFVRPPSHFLRGDLRHNSPAFPGKSAGDIDNLIKSTLDAAIGSLWVDDSQIVDIRASRVYAESAGATVSISAL